MSTICPANEAVERVHRSAIGRVLAPAVLDAVLDAAPSWSRQRKLPRRFMLLFCVLMTLYSEEALPHVFARLVSYGGGAALDSVSAGALCQVCKGSAPLVLTALNNVVLALFDFLGVANIPRQMRRLDAQPAQAVRLLLGSLLTCA